jgi:predicted nuclease of predicted toxin-antitoxin system
MSSNSPIAFLLDENIPKKVLLAMRRAGYTVTRVYDEKLSSQPDSAIFIYARASNKVIVTFDTDYLSRLKFPPPHAGIFVLRTFPRNISVTSLAATILEALAKLQSLDLSNRVFVIKPDEIKEL